MSDISKVISSIIVGAAKAGGIVESSKQSAGKSKPRSKPKAKPSPSSPKKRQASMGMPDEEKTNAAMTAGRGKDLGHGLATMEDMPEEQQAHYIQIGNRIYHRGLLSPQQLARYETPSEDGDGPAVRLPKLQYGGNVVVVSDRDSEPSP